MVTLQEWLSAKNKSNAHIYIKRLSANDTGATGSHQAGAYIPSTLGKLLIPSVNTTKKYNPSAAITVSYSSHSYISHKIRFIYYNNKFFGGTRNEKRFTRWGGGSQSPMQNPENTGALTVFSFSREYGDDYTRLDIWVCRTIDEEEEIELLVGQILPGESIHGPSNEIFGGVLQKQASIDGHYKFPDIWYHAFPTGLDIIQYSKKFYGENTNSADETLIKRRQIEYDIFLKLEKIHTLDRIKEGFDSVDDFILLANSVSNRRKSRAGRSLEIHLATIFDEYGLNSFYTTQATTENNKKPDFIFPSIEAYHSYNFPTEQLRMLAVKTTCKDRWRQVLSEADKIRKKYLFTLQEGVSFAQITEMQSAGIQLVVPKQLHTKYPAAVRDYIISLETLITELSSLYLRY